MTPRRLRLATRSSPLALFQAKVVAEALGAEWPGEIEVELVAVTARADALSEVPIHQLGGQGLFVGEVEEAVLDGRADAAVHSAKDVPSSPELNRLAIAAVLPREDPRDCLVGANLEELGPGALIATGSVRRRAQVSFLRPDLRFCELRGNIGTRLGKIPPEGAIVTAVAALRRVGLDDRISRTFSAREMLPQVGQGAIAVTCREDDETVRALLRPIEDHGARIELEGERGFLGAVGGGCDLPVGALGRFDPYAGLLRLEAMVASYDGHIVVRAANAGHADLSSAAGLGRELAAELMEKKGGLSLLDGGAGVLGRAGGEA